MNADIGGLRRLRAMILPASASAAITALLASPFSMGFRAMSGLVSWIEPP